MALAPYHNEFICIICSYFTNTSPTPLLQRFTDLNTDTVNATFTPGQIASIKGSLLKFNEEDMQQGIFFISADNAETRVSRVVKNKPSELPFLFVLS